MSSSEEEGEISEEEEQLAPCLEASKAIEAPIKEETAEIVNANVDQPLGLLTSPPVAKQTTGNNTSHLAAKAERVASSINERMAPKKRDLEELERGSRSSTGILSSPPSSSFAARKRLSTANSSNRSYANNHSYNNNNNTNSRSVGSSSGNAYARDEYNEQLITTFPRQQVKSQVLLDFAQWMQQQQRRYRTRMNLDDLQEILLNALQQLSHLSPLLANPVCVGKPLPSKLCLVLLTGLCPEALEQYRASLAFFDSCTSVPCAITKAAFLRRKEMPLSYSMFRFPPPGVDFTDIAPEELFGKYQLTFMLNHSVGWKDEVVLQPSGRFFRKTQPTGGEWKLDGDLLHLTWKQNQFDSNDTKQTDETEDDSIIEVDVLAAQDEKMRTFITDQLLDEQYARQTPVHLRRAKPRDGRNPTKRSMRLDLVSVSVMPDNDDAMSLSPTPSPTPSPSPAATPSQESQTPSSSCEQSENDQPVKQADDMLTEKAVEYYVLTPWELRHNDFPIDVDQEQARLMDQTMGNTRDHFVKTGPRPEPTDNNEDAQQPNGDKVASIYALDCEMCETDIGYELTRVTVIDHSMQIVYDQIVKPQSTIINYHTEFSGITKETLESTRTVLADVQQELLSKFFFEDTLLVGHSLVSDLRALRIVHLRVSDTCVLYPHNRGFPYKTSLRYLMKTHLGKEIQQQEGDAGHDSAEDAIAAMELFELKVKNGPLFGIPRVESHEVAQETLLDKLKGMNKRALFVQCVAADPTGTAEAINVCAEKKPWLLFANGSSRDEQAGAIPFCRRVFASSQQHQETSGSNIVVAVEADVALDQAVKSVKLHQSKADVVWIETACALTQREASDEELFINDRATWMDHQRSRCEQMDRFLSHLEQDALDDGTLMMVVPQGDIGLLRHLKGLRVKSRWNDSNCEWTNEMQAAIVSAIRHVLDSCVLFKYKA